MKLTSRRIILGTALAVAVCVAISPKELSANFPNRVVIHAPSQPDIRPNNSQKTFVLSCRKTNWGGTDKYLLTDEILPPSEARKMYNDEKTPPNCNILVCETVNRAEKEPQNCKLADEKTMKDNSVLGAIGAVGIVAGLFIALGSAFAYFMSKQKSSGMPRGTY